MENSISLLPGSYGCVRIPSFYGWLIRVFTRSEYNHSFVCIGDGKIVEARPRGARVSDISDYNGYLMVFDTADNLPQEQRDRIVGTALLLAEVKVKYGFLDIAWLAIHILTGSRAGWLMNLIQDSSTMICSQLVAFCGKWNGVQDWLCGQPDAQEVTPGMLAARCPYKQIISA